MRCAVKGLTFRRLAWDVFGIRTIRAAFPGAVGVAAATVWNTRSSSSSLSLCVMWSSSLAAQRAWPPCLRAAGWRRKRLLGGDRVSQVWGRARRRHKEPRREHRVSNKQRAIEQREIVNVSNLQTTTKGSCCFLTKRFTSYWPTQ